MPENSRISVLVAHRHTMFRQALQAALTSLPGVEVIAEARNGREAVDLADLLRPDVAVVDARLPIISGVEVTRRIAKRGDRPRLVLLAADLDDDMVFEVMRAGASCVLGEGDVAELLLAVGIAHDGGSYLSPRLAERFVQNYTRLASRAAEVDPSLAQLSLREREVLQHLADGRGNRAIAESLTISVKTVEAHRSHIMQKLELKGGAALIRYAARHGLIELEMPEPDPVPGAR